MILDSGATQHMINGLTSLESYIPFDKTEQVRFSSTSGHDAVALGTGSIKIIIPVPGGNKTLMLKSVYYVPQSPVNLLSENNLLRDGYKLLKEKNQVQLVTPTREKLIIKNNGNHSVVHINTSLCTDKNQQIFGTNSWVTLVPDIYQSYN
jgi:hypothetical protein